MLSMFCSEFTHSFTQAHLLHDSYGPDALLNAGDAMTHFIHSIIYSTFRRLLYAKYWIFKNELQYEALI